MARSSSPFLRLRYLAGVVLLAGVASLWAQGGPGIEVRDGGPSGAVIAQGGTVAFGTSPVAVAKPKTIWVKNTGTAELLVAEWISVPQGFTLMASFPGAPNGNLADGAPAFKLAPNATATFTVALNSATAGDFAGPVTFATNVGARNPVSFNVTGQAVSPPSVRYADDVDASFSYTPGWVPYYFEVGGSGMVPFQYYLAYAGPGNGSEAATWTFAGLEPGQYKVSASWAGYPWAASNAPFTVCDGPAPVGTVRVNQQVDSAGFADGGASWQDLGTFTIAGGTLAVKLTNDADNFPVADAVRIERVGYPGAAVDDTFGGGFSTPTGTWVAGYTELGKDFWGTSTYADKAPGATPTATAQWAFTVPAGGTYRVLAGYTNYAWAATNAPFTVLDDATSRGTVRVDQTVAPNDLVEAGIGWRHLGVFTVNANKANNLLVRLGNDANSYVVADAVRVERVDLPATPSEPDAVRFLVQATWGPTAVGITQVRSQGFSAWLNSQFTAPVSGYPLLPLQNTNNNIKGNNTTSCYGDPAVTGNPYRTACVRDRYSQYPNQNKFFTNALYEPDQLRQRLTWSLHKIWVISGVDLPQSAWVAPYLRTLNTHAFGNYRTLMSDVTLNPGMGNYLDMAGSTKTRPNENYPRELLQLFTIGLDELNPDGTRKVDGGGNPLPTYDQPLIEEITKVFTGWNRSPAPSANVFDYINPMVLGGVIPENANNHDFTQRRLLRGIVQPARAASVANAKLNLNEALDNIYNHPNVAPFISKQLIQGLVTSNPSPAYVARVSDAWNRNFGSGNQLREVVRAILLDPEARGDLKPAANYGHLKEPVLFINNLMRLFDVGDAAWVGFSDGYLNPDAVNMGQDVYRPASVFSYYPPAKVASGGPPPVLGPEYGILNTTTTLRRINFVNQSFTPNSNRTIDVVRAKGTTPSGTDPFGQPIVPTGPNGTAVSVASLDVLASNPGALADELSRLMLHGTMDAAMRAEVVTAVNAVAVGNPRKRVRTAVYLVATSAQYQVQQ